MSITLVETEENKHEQEEIGGHMSFLEHLDELRKRLVNSVIFIVIAFLLCWWVSNDIYNFLAIPILRAKSEAESLQLPVSGITGEEVILSQDTMKEGDTGRYVFDRLTRIGASAVQPGTVVQPGTSVQAIAARDATGALGLFTNEPIYIGNIIIPKGVKIQGEITGVAQNQAPGEAKMIVTTATEAFTLFVTVSLYTAIAVSIPFLLFQVWGFISPALYKHERSYVTPFIGLSTIAFVLGAAFAYYILFPPAVKYLIGLGSDFQLMLRATDYFDFITLIMLAMGIIFQMPAIAYVLSRIGIINAGFLLKSWKIALVVILIVAAVVSPTGDIPNMMLFATPMMALYVVSIFIAWFFGKKRKTDAEV